MDDNEVICFCENVTAGDIKKAMKNGCTSFKEVQQATKVATHCGECEERVKGVINYTLDK